MASNSPEKGLDALPHASPKLMEPFDTEYRNGSRGPLGPSDLKNQSATHKTTENGHVVSNDDDQISPIEDTAVGLPVVASQSTLIDPPDTDIADPNVSWYGKTVVQFPLPIIVIIIVLQLTAALCLVLFVPVPQFDQPTRGFEARGSTIKGRAASLWKYQTSISGNSSVAADTMACAVKGSSIFNIVVQSSNEKSLWNAKAVRDICALETQMFQLSSYVNGAWDRRSLGRQIGQLNDKSCDSLDDLDIKNTFSLLLNCSYYYNSGSLKEDCTPSTCPSLPALCTKNGAAFFILHYLTDQHFMSTSNHLTYCRLPIPVSPDHSFISFYVNVIQKSTLDTDDIRVVGLDSDLKFLLFNKLLIQDFIYFALAMTIIVIIAGLYLQSIIVVVAVTADVTFTLITALFVYYIIIRMNFFPFINLITGVVIIALAADDVFLFHQILVIAKTQLPEASVASWISYAMNHAGVSVFTTSLTTSAAFAANLVSDITAIKCFAIFSAIAVLSNFLLMITLIPAVFAMVITNKSSTHGKCTGLHKTIQNFYALCERASGAFFTGFLGILIEKAWFLWIFVFLGLGIGGIVVVLVNPKLELPNDAVFQTFSLSHPVERYDHEFRDIFPFQKDDQTVLAVGLPILFVWGLDEKDNGNSLDPEDNGTLVFDHSFMLKAPASQIFLMKFCKALREAPFVNPHMASIPCTLDLFEQAMTQPCNVTNKSKCCNQNGASNGSYSFHECFPSFYKNQIMRRAGPHPHGVPYFDSNSDVKVFTIGVISTQPFSTGYQPMHDLYRMVTTFSERLMKDAPHSAHNGWFTSLFGFYDAQRALARDTPVAIGVSLGVSSLVTLLTTRSFVLTLFAMLTIGLSIFFLVGILVLLGWKLNALESIVITMAVGLSIDFTIHYGVAFRLSKAPDRVSRMRHCLTSVGPPAAMAAFTTFCAGAAIMPCVIRGYQQLGAFLMLVMISSWMYSTFFFLSLCRLAGPKVQSTCCSCQCGNNASCCCSSAADKDMKAVSDDSHHPRIPQQNNNHHQIDLDRHRQRDISLNVYQNSVVEEGD